MGQTPHDAAFPLLASFATRRRRQPRCRRFRGQRDAGRGVRTGHGRSVSSTATVISPRSVETRQDAPHEGLPDDRCQCPHWGYVVSAVTRYADREEGIRAATPLHAAGHVRRWGGRTEVVCSGPPRSCAQDRGRDEEHAGDAGRLNDSGEDTHGKLFLGQQPLLHRKQAGGGTTRRVDLRVDVFGVVGDRFRRDHQPLGDLLVGEPPREQPEDIDFARRQSGRPSRRRGTRCPAAPSTASTASPSWRPALTSARSSTAADSAECSGR